MIKSREYLDFLACCTALPADAAESDARDRYIRVYTGPNTRDVEHRREFQPRFAYPGTTANQLDDLLWPALERIGRSEMGWIFVQCVDPAEEYAVIQRCKLRCTGDELLQATEAADAANVRVLGSSGAASMFDSHARVVDTLRQQVTELTAALIKMTMSKVEDAAALAKLEALIETATDYNTQALRWQAIQQLGAQLGPMAIQALTAIGVAVASGAKDLGPRPEAGAPRVAWDLRAINVLVGDALGLVVADMAVLADDEVMAALNDLVAQLQRVQALAAANGIDVSEWFAPDITDTPEAA